MLRSFKKHTYNHIHPYILTSIILNAWFGMVWVEPSEGLHELATFSRHKQRSSTPTSETAQMRSFPGVFIVLVTMLCSDCLSKTESPLSLQTFAHELGLHFPLCSLDMRWFQAHPSRLGIPNQASDLWKLVASAPNAFLLPLSCFWVCNNTKPSFSSSKASIRKC